MPYKDKSVQREFQRVWKNSRTDRLRQLKENKPCTDCGLIYHIAAMEWDHLPGSTKVRNLANMQQYSLKRVLEEIDKCELVCANCHRIRTFNRSKAVGAAE